MSYWGLDVSLTSTGVAEILTNGLPRVDTIETKAIAGLAGTVTRIDSIVEAVRTIIPGDSLVAIESPAYASKFGQSHERAGLWWAIGRSLVHRGCLVTTVSPNELKKWATGKGTAPKDMVAMHVGRLYPELEIANNNEADALVLAHMGAARGAVNVPRRAYHVPANFAKIDWAWDVLTQPSILA